MIFVTCYLVTDHEPTHPADYFLLEEAYRTADLATRDNAKPSARLPKRPSIKHQQILKHASKTNTTVRFLSQGMKRREENTTMYLAKYVVICPFNTAIKPNKYSLHHGAFQNESNIMDDRMGLSTVRCKETRSPVYYAFYVFISFLNKTYLTHHRTPA